MIETSMQKKFQVNFIIYLEQTIVSSLVILSTILMISWIFQNHIQKVLHLTGGIFGIFIIFLMPLI